MLKSTSCKITLSTNDSALFAVSVIKQSPLPGVRRSLTRLLHTHGFEVTSAATASAAMAALDGQDIVILDRDLPDGPGTIVFHKIRRENRPIRVAIWTGRAIDDLPREFAPKPDAMFFKPEVKGLLSWIGEP